jgi:leucyl-tRNA synthetase
VSSWPTYDPSLAADETVTLVVQVNGKVRDKLEVDADIPESDAEELARQSPGAQRALDGLAVRRVIVRAPKLVNIVAS